jgi:hypothetical protein
MSCTERPYNIRTNDDLNSFYSSNNGNINRIESTYVPIDYPRWLTCIWNDINKDNIDVSNINTQILNWNIDHDNDTTATELNNYSMTLYEADLKYTFSKIIFFIILAIVYIYFFKVNGIVTPIITLFGVMKQKIMVDIPLAAEKAIKKMPNVAEKVLPEKVLPEKVLPKVPEKTIKNMSNVSKIKT